MAPQTSSIVALALLLFASLSAATTPARDYFSEPRGDFASRRLETLNLATSSPRPALDAQLARLALDRGPLDAAVIRRSLAKIGRRDDTSDFDAVMLLRLLGHPGSLLTAELRAEIRATLLGFKYWVDEPGTDLLSM